MSALSPAMSPVLLDKTVLRPVGRVVFLYLLLVGYAFAYTYFFATLTAGPTGLNQRFIIFDPSRLSDYVTIVLLTPVAMLPIGTRLRTPGQMIYALSCVFFFIPIPVQFLAMVPARQYWVVYIVLWISSAILALTSRICVKLRVRTLSVTGYRHLSIGVMCFFAISLLLAARNGIHIVGFADIYKYRMSTDANLKISPIFGYPIAMFIGTFGGFAVATAVAFRKYSLIALSVLCFVLAYGVSAAKTAAMGPAWLLYIAVADRYFIKGGTNGSMIRFLAVMASPYVVMGAIWTVVGQSPLFSQMIILKLATYELYSLSNYRLFTIPPEAFSVYYDFFQTHPYTYWSHINIVGMFVTYPYAQPLPVVMQNTYFLGDYNTGFITTDGLAAGGIAAIPFISIVMSLVVIAMNSTTSRLNVRYLIIAMSVPLVAFIDAPLSTWLLTYGAGPMCLLFLFAPRGPGSPVGRTVGTG